MPSVEEQLAWAGGLFEGEGWFSRQKSGSPVACIRSTDQDTIVRFGEIMGGVATVRIYSVDKGEGHKRQWHWGITGYDKVRRFGELLGPWLMERRRDQLQAVLGEDAPERIELHPAQIRLVEAGQ